MKTSSITKRIGRGLGGGEEEGVGKSDVVRQHQHAALGGQALRDG